jgi:type 1 fimbriae regulatory protein FimB/type 1 fimbriae regulatory protein FimE
MARRIVDVLVPVALRLFYGTPSTHPVQGNELRALRRLQRESPSSPFVFVTERGAPFTTAGSARIIEQAAAGAGLELKAHPHMRVTLVATPSPTRATTPGRSRTGSATDRSPRPFTTALAPNRFKDFWRE